MNDQKFIEAVGQMRQAQKDYFKLPAGNRQRPAQLAICKKLEAAVDHALKENSNPLLLPRACRHCGCTDDDCRGCIIRTGQPCHWVEKDLCSACNPQALKQFPLNLVPQL